MFVHIALFKWKKGVKEEKIDLLLSGLKFLEGRLNGIRSIHIGKNIHPEGKGFTHGVVVIGESAEAIQKYRDHPVHLELAGQIDDIESDGIGCDFQDMLVLF